MLNINQLVSLNTSRCVTAVISRCSLLTGLSYDAMCFPTLQVTLMKNLELYGIDPATVAIALQHRVQASSLLSPVPGSKDKVLVQIQGNQVQHVGSLLLGRYRVTHYRIYKTTAFG